MTADEAAREPAPHPGHRRSEPHQYDVREARLTKGGCVPVLRIVRFRFTS
jgi:hypothetical protein